MVGAGHACRDVIVDQLVPTMSLRKAATGGELDPKPPFVLAYQRVGERRFATAHCDRVLHRDLLSQRRP